MPLVAACAETPQQVNDRAKLEQARKVCIEHGVKEGMALEDCILDVALTGKSELADDFVFAPKPKQVIHEH